MTVYDNYAGEADAAYQGAGFGESSRGFARQNEETHGSVFTWFGGVASLALIAGLAMWSYDLVLRDIAGVPVIKALDGPMRVQPEQHGGSQADYQGLAVNQVQAAGVAADAPAQIMLAPRPLDLSDATPPSAELASAPDMPMTEAQVLQAVYAPPATPEPVRDATRDTGLAVEALLSEIVAEEEATGDIVPTSVPGVNRSPRPPARPADMRTASLTPPAALPSAQPEFVDPTTLTPGTRMVQFRAYSTEADARNAWEALYADFGEFMQGKSPVILPSSDGATTFYRLRMTGFDDMADAQRFCSVFLAANRDCVPLQF